MGLDFFRIKEKPGMKKDTLEVYPDFQVGRSKDLMVRAKSFYAIWDGAKGLWSQDEYDVQRLVDEEIQSHELYTEKAEHLYDVIHRRYLSDFGTSSWLQFRNYIAHLSDNSHTLDENLTFANTEVKKEDYVSKRLPYALAEGDISAYQELFSVLYTPEEFAKLEWAIGAIISGDSKFIQKFIMLYGAGGTGKSTWLQLVQWLTEGYFEMVDLKELTSANNMFAMDFLRNNPLVAIDHDTDLSRVQDNTKLNQLVSHEYMKINEKNKPSYMARFNAFFLGGTNTAVKIPDSKSGLLRRLIDVQPTGEKVSPRKYQTLMGQIQFELGAIAWHCLQVYREMGKDYYNNYRPVEMMLQTNIFYNFIEANYDVFGEQNGTTLKQAYLMFKEFCSETGVEFKMPQYRFREELKSYFNKFEERAELPDGTRVRSWFSEFNAEKFKVQVKDDMVFSLVMDDTESLLDERYSEYPAQYSNSQGNPIRFWDGAEREVGGKKVTPKPDQIVSTILSDLNTKREHYVNIDEHEIVIDFDLRDPETGEKSLERNLEAASQWPPTYAEISKSGLGIHLHYFYEGDVSELTRVYEEGIEIKVYTGNQALRRKLTRCNNIPVATMPDGALPKKEKKVNEGESDRLHSEKSLRALIERNLRKEIHPGTKPSMDFIHKILEDAYKSDLSYDVTDMRNSILAFGANSSNQPLYCISLVQEMKFKSEEQVENFPEGITPETFKSAKGLADAEPLTFYDVEVFPNLFVICWKYKDNKSVVRLINPTAQEVEALLTRKLVGFNNRRYDNHILYGAMMGLSNEGLYHLSKKLISGSSNAYFGEAWNLSYTDIYDFASAGNKHGLKWFQIKLGLNHKELGLPWDEPVPKERWQEVADYCANDVITTEEVFDYLESDWIARQMLAQLSGLSVNDTTNKHSTKIMFGEDRHPQEEFNYTDLSEMFPGYKFDLGKSTYKGFETGEGGFVYAEPGMYTNVAVLDVVSMHPTSIEQLDLFGSYTKRFSEIKKARVFIKRGDYEAARGMLDGKLASFLGDDADPKGISDALKTVINSVYGLTSARFENSFKDPRNIDNIVAKRGALFMVDLMLAVQELGYKVIHIKTDSIKIPDADKFIMDFVMEFGEKYGYEFEHEVTYEKFCLVNDAVYIAKTQDGRKPSYWDATGAQFQHPYVFKTLFSGEKIKFEDMQEIKQVQTALYLDFSENIGDDDTMALATNDDAPRFVGRAGAFCPIQPGKGGGRLVREKDGKFHSATGASGFHWLEADVVRELGKEKDIDLNYFRKLVDAAIANISKYGDFDWFTAA